MINFEADLTGLVEDLEAGNIDQAQVRLDEMLHDAKRLVEGVPSESKGSEERRVFAEGPSSPRRGYAGIIRGLLLDIANPLIANDPRSIQITKQALAFWKDNAPTIKP